MNAPPDQPPLSIQTDRIPNNKDALTSQQIVRLMQTIRKMRQQGADHTNPQLRALVAVLKSQDLSKFQNSQTVLPNSAPKPPPPMPQPTLVGQPPAVDPTVKSEEPSATSAPEPPKALSKLTQPPPPLPMYHSQSQPQPQPQQYPTQQAFPREPAAMQRSGQHPYQTMTPSAGTPPVQGGYPPRPPVQGGYPPHNQAGYPNPGVNPNQGGYPRPGQQGAGYQSQPQQMPHGGYPKPPAMYPGNFTNPRLQSSSGYNMPGAPGMGGTFGAPANPKAQLLPIGPGSSHPGPGRPQMHPSYGAPAASQRGPESGLPPANVLFGPQQIRQLRAQIATFKCIVNNSPVPPEHLTACQSRQPASSYSQPASAGASSAYISQVTPVTQPATGKPPAKAGKKKGGRKMEAGGLKTTTKPPPAMEIPRPGPLVPLFDVHTLMNDREKRLRFKLASRSQELLALQKGGAGALTVSTCSLQSTSLSVEEQVELAQLKLLNTQLKCRYEVTQCLRRAQEMKSSAKGATKRKRSRGDRSKVKRQVKQTKEKEFLAAVVAHAKVFKEAHLAQGTKWKKINRQMTSYHTNKARKEEQLREKQEKERLRALKENDEVAYLKLLEQTKNDRLSQLLNQTDDYLNQIGAKVREVKDKGEEPQGAEAPATKRSLSEMTEEERKAFLKKEEEEAKQLQSTKTYYATAHTIQEEVTQPDILVGGTLKPYQLRGLQWLVSLYNNKLNGVLADEMGLGKTIQTIALLTYLVERKGCAGPFLIIVPLAVMYNWVNELAQWAPSLVSVAYRGDAKQRKALYQAQLAPGKFNVALTTYDFIIRDKTNLAKIQWQYIIIDEGHRIKNANSKLNQTLIKFYKARYRLLLTGTPLQNSLPELWSLLNFLLPTIFNSVDNFQNWFNAPFAAAADRSDMTEEETTLIIHRLHKVLRPFLLRRLKKEVEDQLPSKVERVLRCESSAMQRRLYDSMASNGIMLCDPSTKKSKMKKSLNNTLMELRKVCNHPYLCNPADYHINEDMVRCAGKFLALDNLLRKLKATGHRVLIFSQMTEVMTILGDMMSLRGYQFLRLDGNTASEDRGELPDRFNAPDSPYFVFILSTRAGGQGLNLQAADTVIIFDSDWNPQMDLQAMDRAHRIGQKREVRVFRLITVNSVEESILEKANHKLDVDKKIIQAGMFNNSSSVNERREFLQNLLKSEHEDHAEDESQVPSPERFNKMISRSDEEFALFQQMDVDRLRQRQEEWVAAGHTEPLPPLLMQESELPEWLTKEPEVVVDEFVYGRGQRQRSDINYDVNELVQFSDDDSSSTKEEGFEEPPPRRSRGRSKKRKRKVTEEYGPGELDESPVRKRQRSGSRKKRAAVDDEFKAKLIDVWDVVRHCKDEYGRERSYLFIELPTRTEYPDYFQIIKNPIDLKMIRQRIEDDQYTSVTQFRADMDLLFHNACLYNVEGSVVYHDALQMKEACYAAIKEQFD